MPVVSKNTGGLIIAFPDVCTTPSPPSGVPVPYPNMAMTATSKQQAKKLSGIKTTGVGSSFKQSTADKAGVLGGIVSSKLAGPKRFTSKQVEVQGLKVSLGHLNLQLQNMTSSDPAEWQKVIEQYVSTVSAIYVTLHD